MVMSSSQPMTLVLCQIVPYPHLDENHDYNFREISLLVYNIFCPPTKHIMDDASSFDEYIDQIEAVLTNQYMELRYKDRDKL